MSHKFEKLKTGKSFLWISEGYLLKIKDFAKGIQDFDGSEMPLDYHNPYIHTLIQNDVLMKQSTVRKQQESYPTTDTLLIQHEKTKGNKTRWNGCSCGFPYEVTVLSNFYYIFSV